MLHESFYELLQNFSTFPAAQNFFLVNIDTLPSAITENNINKLGVRTGTTSSGLDTATTTFQPYFGGGNNWMFLATGIDLTTETTNVNNRGTLINGLLPVGPFMEAREYPDNDLDIQFSDTNIRRTREALQFLNEKGILGHNKSFTVVNDRKVKLYHRK